MERQGPEHLIDKVADLILSSKKVVVFTGAGVSTESGIPDFRSPGGIWTKYDPDSFTYQKFVRDAETRGMVWQMLVETFMVGAEPDPAHIAIAELERMGKLDCVITQNVDNLHQEAGNDPDKVFELHGNMKWALCLSCGKRYPLGEIKKRVEQGIKDPNCDDCHGILKPDAVFFGESLPERVLREATRRSRESNLFIVVGSTLVVTPAAYMPQYAVEAGAKLVIINLSSTPLDGRATVLIQGKAGETMSKVMEQVRSKSSSI